MEWYDADPSRQEVDPAMDARWIGWSPPIGGPSAPDCSELLILPAQAQRNSRIDT